MEGTLAQGIRVWDLRHARYFGLAKIRVQHVITAASLNVIRMTQWLEAAHHATTRRAPFLALLPPAA